MTIDDEEDTDGRRQHLRHTFIREVLGPDQFFRTSLCLGNALFAVIGSQRQKLRRCGTIQVVARSVI